MNKIINCGCGGVGKIEAYHDILVPGEPINWKRIRCSECNIRTPWRHTEAEAIQAWNKAMGERTETVKNFGHPCGTYGYCSNCGGYCVNEEPYCPHCGIKLEWE